MSIEIPGHYTREELIPCYTRADYKLTAYIQPTVLVKSFAHLIGRFFLASLEEIGKLWNWWTVYSGVLQLIVSYATMLKVSPPL